MLRRYFYIIAIISLFIFCYFIFALQVKFPIPKRIFRFPEPLSDHPRYPSSMKLMDLNDFKYINNPVICSDADPVLAVVLVHTHPSNSKMRQTFRNEIPQSVLDDVGLKRVFLLGRAVTDQVNYPITNQSIINSEIVQHNDIVQGNFIEHYRNLTYKHVMGLKWVTQFCSQTKFVIKMDDDIAVDFFQISQMLKYRYRNIKNEMLGLVLIDQPVIRFEDSKWNVLAEEYEPSTYPKFLSGWCYVASYDAVSKIVSKVNDFKCFFIDDAFITGIVAEEVGVKRQGLNNKYTTNKDHLQCCSDPKFKSDIFYCDYIAAPSEKDINLMSVALKQFYRCYKRGCERRLAKATIGRTCVVPKRPNELPTGRGVGEVFIV